MGVAQDALKGLPQRMFRPRTLAACVPEVGERMVEHVIRADDLALERQCRWRARRERQGVGLLGHPFEQPVVVVLAPLARVNLKQAQWPGPVASDRVLEREQEHTRCQMLADGRR